eukprot:GAFH01002484.1.p2 GENE.GAFH01002484.1~~GAFH01002484.1.p2  ORF type:complete len:334 (+),score=48.50 GAFH01002484.1:69-1070(+)
MSNIHTIADLGGGGGGREAPPPAQPMGNFWANQQRAQRVNPSAYEEGRGGGAPPAAYPQMGQMQLVDPFWSPNLPPGSPFGCQEIFCMQCCPCCIGPCCSPVRRFDYKRLLKTFTFWISVVQVIMFIVEVSMGGFSQNLGPNTATLLALGAKYAPYIKCYFHIHRLFLPAILHGGIFHLLFNLLFQWRIMLYQEAPREKPWGLWRTVVIFWVSTLSSSLLSCLLYPAGAGVGSSGALCGIFGAFCAIVARDWRTTPAPMRWSSITMIIFFFMGMIFFGFFTTGATVDNGAHLGGLLAGIFLGMLIFSRTSGFASPAACCLAGSFSSRFYSSHS